MATLASSKGTEPFTDSGCLQRSVNRKFIQAFLGLPVWPQRQFRVRSHMECGATAFCLVSLRTSVTVFHHGSVLLLNHFVLKLTDPGRIFAVVNALGKPEVRFGIQTVLVSEESTFLLFEIFSPLRASHLAGQFLSSPSTIAGRASSIQP